VLVDSAKSFIVNRNHPAVWQKITARPQIWREQIAISSYQHSNYAFHNEATVTATVAQLRTVTRTQLLAPTSSLVQAGPALRYSKSWEVKI